MCGTAAGLTHEGSLNQLGGRFLNGRPLPAHTRRMMITLASEGMRPCHISRILKVSSGCVSKILHWYRRTGLMGPKAIGGSRPRLLTPHVISTIACYKRTSPSLFAWEIREKLSAERVCSADKVPSVSSINRILKKLQHNQDMEKYTCEGIICDKMDEKRQNSFAPGEMNQQPNSSYLQSTQQRNRTHFSLEQCEMLEKEFLQGHYPDLFAREKLSTDTNLSQDTIKVWFSNRRAKMRREMKAGESCWPSHGLAHPHSLGCTTVPFSPSVNWLRERTALPGTSQMDSRSSLAAFPVVQNTETTTLSLAHCSSNMRAGFPSDHHLNEANMLRSHHRQEESAYSPSHFTQWAARPSFTGQYL
ncbi:paired box protein Pax-4 isoform X2 [Colossoma macropomum]|uniref:paired box protein Pax-4 isoform X2 n=1 Tax=Colossoma macropomum TaxID=42526 RepID=UPI001863B5A2|nr:paired box protein Pax-4 isoform X2 [Colossoma macropomum]